MLLPSWVLLDFHLHRAEIIRTKCVERAKPIEKNCCKGSCHLKKELKKASGEQEKAPTEPRFERTEVNALSPVQTRMALLPTEARNFPLLIARERKGHTLSVDHVPWLG